MTPDLARALMVWLRDRQTGEGRAGPDEKSLLLKMLPAAKDCPQVLLDFLFERVGAENFILTRSGWGVPADLMVDFLGQARAVLNNQGRRGHRESPGYG